MRDDISSMEIENEASLNGATTANPKASNPRRWLGFVALICLMVAAAIGINLPYRYKVIADVASGERVVFIEPAEYVSFEPAVTAAGWPWQYRLTFKYENDDPLDIWSIKRLVGNIAVVTGCVLFIGLIGWSRQRRMQTQLASTFSVSIFDVLILISIAALPLAYWRLMMSRSRENFKLQEQIVAAGGVVICRASIPEIAAPYAPSLVADMYQRIVDVELHSPNDELIQKVIKLPYLEQLKIVDGNYAVKPLADLANNPRLWNLRIAGRRFEDAKDLDWIGSMPQLRSLNLMRTNVSASMVNAWDDTVRLSYLNLVHTDVKLSELGVPPWSRTIRRLHLPRPPAGQEDVLRVSNWPKLEQIGIYEFDELLNKSPLRVELTNLPELQLISLDQTQKFDFLAKNLPKLTKFSRLAYAWRGRVSNRQQLPGALWFRSFDIENVPALKGVNLFGVDLEHFRARGISSEAALGIGVFGHSPSSEQAFYIKNIPIENRQAWIDGVAESEGPALIDLASIPLQGLRLDELKKNQGIRILDLSDTKTQPEQWKQLEGMTQLVELRLAKAQVDGPMIEWMTEHLPNLKRLIVDGGYFMNSLRLEKNSHFEQLTFAEGTPQLSALRLVDLPNLKSSIHLQEPVRHLVVQGTPKMIGLTSHGAVPEDCVLRDFQDLEVFGVGGKAVTDEMIRDVLSCPRLSKLSLAFTSVKAETLSSLGKLRSLRHLVLAGPNIDDSVIDSLSGLAQLETLVLFETSMSTGYLKSLSKLKGLKQLSLLGHRFADPDMSWLNELKRLVVLRLEGIKPSAHLFSCLQNVPLLEKLGLEGIELTQDDFQALANINSSSLTRLSLRRSKLSSVGLSRLAKALPAVVFELRDADVEVEIESRLAGSGRVVMDYEDESQFGLALNPRFRQGEDEVRYSWEVHDQDLLRPERFTSQWTEQRAEEEKKYAELMKQRTQAAEAAGNSNSASPPSSSSFWFRALKNTVDQLLEGGPSESKKEQP